METHESPHNGSPMKLIWKSYGSSMGTLRPYGNPLEFLTEVSWENCEGPMGALTPRGSLVGDPWKFHGSPMRAPKPHGGEHYEIPWGKHGREVKWKSHGSTAIPCKSRGNPMKAPWESLKSTKVPWESHGWRMGVLCKIHESAIDPMKSHGSPVEVPWECYKLIEIPWEFHEILAIVPWERSHVVPWEPHESPMALP